MKERFITLKISLIVNTLIFIVGFILLILGSILLITKTIQASNSDTVSAKVTNVIDTDSEHIIWIEYTYNDKTYTDTLPYWSDELDNGSIVSIYVNKDDPTIFYGSKKGYLYLSTILLAVGISTFLFKGIEVLSYFLEKKRINYLLTKPIYLGKIVCVEEDSKNYSFGVTPKIIVVEIKIGDVSYALPSKDVWIKENISSYTGKTIKVYSDTKEFKNYYIDILSIE